MSKYYRGHIRHHATFWVHYRELPAADRYAAFLNFFETINQEVKDGTCGLESAAYALEPGCNDDETYLRHEFELTFVQDAVEDLAIVARTDQQEARKIWDYIVRIMSESSKLARNE